MGDLSLKKAAAGRSIRGPVVLVVMDGVGVGKEDEGNAVWLARTPVLDRLRESARYTQLAAHGTAVGLPSDDDMGNSEVGHNAIGAGRVFDQGAKLVKKAIADKSLFEGEAWRTAVSRIKASGEPLHFIGLLSDGGVHSHIDHLFALLARCHEEQVERVRIHALLDGRDVPETSALTYVDSLEKELTRFRDAGRDYCVASGGGRMTTTMDRYEADWAMVERGYHAHVHGTGDRFPSLHAAVTALRDRAPGTIDQNLPHFVITGDDGEPRGPIRDGASVIFFNFRGDRAIEISRAFDEDDFNAFDRGARPDVFYAGMMQYDGDLPCPKHFLVSPPVIDRTLGAYLAAAGMTQLAISETQKYGHVTYFWNGNRSGKFDPARETYIEIPSDTRPFEERPWMKAAEITDAMIDELRTGRYDHARVNYANGDMVGHTGVRDAAVQAVEAVDLSLGRLAKAVHQLDGALIVTADHGNADEMYELDKSGAFKRRKDGTPKAKTSHTLAKVPCYIQCKEARFELDANVVRPGLSNLAATVLCMLGFEAPSDYEPSLLTR